MELGFDHNELRNTLETRHESLVLRPVLDWAGLRARFIAAHALRRSINEAPGQGGGTFAEDAAGFLALAREGSTLVNPKDSANGKGPPATDINIVGTTPAIDDRGMI